MCEDPYECILQHIFRIVSADNISGADSFQIRCITGIEFLHRPVFTVAKPLDQALFVTIL